MEEDFIESTLCWIIKDGKALLQLRSSGISEGRWNAVGGVSEHGETALECLKREVLEETSLLIEEPKYHGILKFFFGDGKIKKPWLVHIFSVNKFSGKVKGNEEGELKWFDLEEIPLKKMWQDDSYWVPLMLEGKKFEGEFFFNDDGSELLKHDLREG